MLLPSNSIVSSNLFPNNTSSSFRVKLPHPVQLYGDWEVGLAEIHLPIFWNNVTQENNSFEIEFPQYVDKTVDEKDKEWFEYYKLNQNKSSSGVIGGGSGETAINP